MTCSPKHLRGMAKRNGDSAVGNGHSSNDRGSGGQRRNVEGKEMQK